MIGLHTIYVCISQFSLSATVIIRFFAFCICIYIFMCLLWSLFVLLFILYDLLGHFRCSNGYNFETGHYNNFLKNK